MPGPVAITRKAYAKLNLMLSVGAPHPDPGPKAGWHPIASWMACIDLFDDVSIEPASESRIEVAWAADAPRPTPIDWPPEKDLAARAHRVMETKAGRALPAHIRVTKRIPAGGGMGGGAADASAVILGLNSAFSLGLKGEALRAAAAEIGSDVAFFTDEDSSPARPALVSGFGEVIERIHSLAAEVVVIVPPYGCETPAVYREYDTVLTERAALDRSERAVRGITGREKQTGPREEMIRGRIDRMSHRDRIDGDLLFNDLSAAAFRIEPRLGALVTALARGTRERVHVTGSGSCLFIATLPGKVDRIKERVTRTLATAEPGAVVLSTVVV
jgi:4-diphosphocytidyl-2C-methyl-D-erythritol kinase